MTLALATHAVSTDRDVAPTPAAPFPGARLGSGEAQTRARLLAAFDGLEFADGACRLRANAAVGPSADHDAGSWLWFDTPLGPVAMAALRLDGAPAGWPTGGAGLRESAALAAIGRLEFVIQALETQGPGWRPVGFGAADGLSVRLDLMAEDGQLVHQLALSVPESALAKLPARAPDLSRLPQAVPLAAVLIARGPSIPAAELSSLVVGDLVWLGDGGPCQARIHVEGALQAEGQFDPALRQFRSSTPLQSAPSRAGEAPMSLDIDESPDPRASGAPLSLEDLPVRISFEFGPWPARLADVARIAPGAVLPVLAGDAEPEVRLTVEGRVLARGRLVALGRRYGVLVDSVER